MRRGAAALLSALLLAAGPGGPALAQGGGGLSGPISVAPQVLTIDPDRLLDETALGARIASRLEDESRALASENRRIEAELTAEERALTERRPGLPVDEFRALADAFDEKVQRIRAEQDAKARELQRRSELERQSFFREIVPILSDIVRDRGALMILDRREVFLSADAVDVTDEAIGRINAGLDAAPAAGDE